MLKSLRIYFIENNLTFLIKRDIIAIILLLIFGYKNKYYDIILNVLFNFLNLILIKHNYLVKKIICVIILNILKTYIFIKT